MPIEITKAEETSTPPQKPEQSISSSDFIPTEEKLRFKDVVGLDEAKQLLKRTVGMSLTHKDEYEHYGKERKLGLLLYGPPGSGKTFIAKALAGEFAIPIIIANIAELISEYVGETAKNIAAIFKQVNDTAKENGKGCILFFDEFDAIARKRSGRAEGEAAALRSALDTLLTEMDGVSQRNEDTFIIAATNMPWELDAAVKRAGRFEDMLYIGLPKLSDRRKLLKKELARASKDVVSVWTWRVARATYGWSNADLKKLCDDSKAFAMERKIAGKSGKITTGLMVWLASRTKTAGNIEWFAQAKDTLKNMGDADQVYAPLKKESESLTDFQEVKSFIRIFSLYIF